MAIQRALLIAFAFLFAIVLHAYVYVQGLWHHAGTQPGPLSLNRCDADTVQPTQKVNPNKMLFISCGGFLE